MLHAQDHGSHHHGAAIASRFDCLSAHVVAGDGKERDALLDELRRMLHHRFGIDHITIQLEAVGFVEAHPDCGPARSQAGTRLPV